jgi:tetratricopeptide (TPR) repeat protein
VGVEWDFGEGVKLGFLFNIFAGLIGHGVPQVVAAVADWADKERNHHLERLICASLAAACQSVGKTKPASSGVMQKIAEWAKKEFGAQNAPCPQPLWSACLRGDPDLAREFLTSKARELAVSILDDDVWTEIREELPKRLIAAFGELLKHDEHRKGLIAFQRECFWELMRQPGVLAPGQPQPAAPNEVSLSEDWLTKVENLVVGAVREVLRKEIAAFRAEFQEEAAKNEARAAANAAAHALTHEQLNQINAKFDALTIPMPGKRLLWTAPRPNPFFTGQEEIIAQLERALKAGKVGGLTQPTGLKGMGGIGKTEVALAYAFKRALDYKEAHFVVADSLASLESGLARIVQPVGAPDPTGDQVAAEKQKALRHLSTLGSRALVIFDNVDDIVKTKEFQEVLASLPQSHILITCRHSDMGSISAVPVEKMDEGTGALFVLRHGLGSETEGPWQRGDFRHQDWEEALGLSRDLDGLPLALHHAGAMIRGEGISVKRAREIYRSNRRRLLENRGDSVSASHPDSIWVTTVTAWENLKQRDEAAAELLVCCAFLFPDLIPESLFTTEGAIKPRPPLAGSPSFDRHRPAGLRPGLVDSKRGEEVLVMHRVVQAILQDLQPDIKERTMEIGNSCTNYFYTSGFFRLSVSQAEHVMAIWHRLAQPHSQGSLFCQNNLAAAYWAMGRNQEALELEIETLRIRRETFGEKHPDTLISQSNLAATYMAMGRIQEALELQEHALSFSRETLGERHPDTLTSQNNLAGTYSAMGRNQEALELHIDTLRIRRETLGEEHSSTLTSQNNLAETYRAMGRIQEALELQEHALSISREALGERHPDTLTRQNNLASTYWAMGRNQEALDLEEDTLRIIKETLGERHPNTLTSQNNLAETYKAMGRIQEALELNKSTLRIRREALGEKHPDTFTSRNNLAMTYRAMGRREEAEALLVTALKGAEEVLGPDHPTTKTIRENLAELRETF